MNRRTFFNLIGKVALGTIIALNIPETLIPTIKELKELKITTIKYIFPKDIPFDELFTIAPFIARLRR